MRGAKAARAVYSLLDAIDGSGAVIHRKQFIKGLRQNGVKIKPRNLNGLLSRTRKLAGEVRSPGQKCVIFNLGRNQGWRLAADFEEAKKQAKSTFRRQAWFEGARHRTVKFAGETFEFLAAHDSISGYERITTSHLAALMAHHSDDKK